MRKIAVLDLETGTWRTVLEGGFGARYIEGGYLVYAAAGALWATRFDCHGWRRVERRSRC